MTREKIKMPMDLYKKIVSQAVEMGIRRLDFSHYNEVFLDDLFVDRIRYAKEKGLTVFTFSNGSKTKPKDIDPLLDSGLDLIIFSIDGGTKKSFEEIRKGADFDKTVGIIQALLKRRKERSLSKPAIHIHSTILSKKNQKTTQYLHQIFDGADSFTIGLVDSRGDQGNYHFAQEVASNGRQTKLYPCVSPFGELTVMSSGEVCLCCRDYDGSVIIGDLRKQTLQEVYNSKKLEEIQRLHLNGQGDQIDICKNCDALYRATLSWWRNG
ncbi:hypothetical protein UR09_00005 [Candidatus Nitromaritima sp. SCGC AAA799-A02]|nr:hypothetical protein UR09_00005 [Candidatus Nitromaritima sp. SCGC AAA799-A02]